MTMSAVLSEMAGHDEVAGLAAATRTVASALGHIGGFAVSVLFYFAVFAGVGLLFRATDRGIRGRLARRRTDMCAKCGRALSDVTQRRGDRLCKRCRRLEPAGDGA